MHINIREISSIKFPCREIQYLRNEAAHQLDAAGFTIVHLYIKLPISNYGTPFSLRLSLQRPLYGRELPFLAALPSPETCQDQLHTLFKVQRVQRPTKHTYARCPGCFRVSRAYLISVSCAHSNPSPCASVCAAGGTSLLLWLLRWPKASSATPHLSSPFSWRRGWEGKNEGRTWVGEGGRREKKGKAGGQMMVKWPPPWDQMRGALKARPCAAPYRR